MLIPLAAVVWRSGRRTASTASGTRSPRPEASSTLKLTIGASLLVALINTVHGHADRLGAGARRLPGSASFDTLIDLPFALPTIVAGLALLALYGPDSPLGLDLAYTRAGVVVALLFVTLPFVVRTVQPVLLELDREMEEAAASLGRQHRRRSSAGSSCRTSPRRWPPARRWRSPGRSASSARPCSSPATCPFKTQVAVGAHLQPDRERQRHRRGRGLDRAARRRRSSCSWRSTCSSAGGPVVASPGVLVATAPCAAYAVLLPARSCSCSRSG